MWISTPVLPLVLVWYVFLVLLDMFAKATSKPFSRERGDTGLFCDSFRDVVEFSIEPGWVFWRVQMFHLG